MWCLVLELVLPGEGGEVLEGVGRRRFPNPALLLPGRVDGGGWKSVVVPSVGSLLSRVGGKGRAGE